MKSKDLKSIYSGKTFAEAASIISNKYKKRDTDLTQKLSYEMEIAELMKLNEAVKMQSEADAMVKDKLKCGGKVKMACGGKVKMEEGNFLTDPTAGVPPGNTSWIAQQQLPNPPLTDAAPPRTGLPLMPLFTLPTLNKPPLQNLAPVGMASNLKSVSPTIPTKSPKPLESKLNVDKTLSQSIAEMKENALYNQTATKRPNIFQRMFGENSNIYNPALAGLAANMGLNAAILAGGYDKEAPQTNKYESDVRRLMEGRGIDSTAVQNRINASMRANMENTQNVRSANVRNALLQNIGATAMEQTSGAELQAQQVRNQLTGEYAGMLNNLGLQESQARMTARELTARNKGQFLTNLSKLGQTAAEGGKFFTTLKANDKLNELYTNVLNLKFEDFGVGTDLIKKIRNGEELSADDIVQLKNSKSSVIKQFAEYYERSVGASTNKPAGTTTTPTTTPTGGNTSTTPTTTTTGSSTQTGTSTTTTPAGNTPSTTTSSSPSTPATTPTGTPNTQKTGTTNTPVSQTGTTNQPASGASTPTPVTTTKMSPSKIKVTPDYIRFRKGMDKLKSMGINLDDFKLGLR